jgi:long-chain acyl-CoA synthetase
MKDYSDWKPSYDYENESPYLESLNQPWLKYRPLNVPKSIKFDPIPVHELIKLSAKNFSNNVCIYNKSANKKYTYRELIYISDKIANVLFQLGVKKGDPIGIMTSNCPEFIFCCIGIMETGAIVVPINPLLKEGDVAHIIRESRNMQIVFVHKGNYRTIKKVQKEIKIDNIILLQANVAKEGTTTFEEFIDGITPNPPDIVLDPSENLVALLFTGGTTGLPKGVMLTHTNLVSCTLSYLLMGGEAEEEIENFGKTVNLSVLPMCHSFGFLVSIIALFGAAMLVVFDSFNPSEILEAIEYFKVNNFVGVPVMYQMLINSPDFTERDLSSLEEANSGTAALAPELAKRWEQVVGIKVGQGFGLTETSPITHIAAKWMPKIRSESIGIPIIDTDAKIVNSDTLEELSPGEIGEILIRGPQVMKGYWNNPEATKKTIVNGWLRTGDLARMDAQGYFYIEGRAKDIIKYKGYKVMPREVEEKLYEHPAIQEVGVVSAPDSDIGETIKAYLVLKPEYKDGKITEHEVIEWAKERLAAYKYPRRVEFIDILPRTTVGKIFRRKLRENALKN